MISVHKLLYTNLSSPGGRIHKRQRLTFFRYSFLASWELIVSMITILVDLYDRRLQQPCNGDCEWEILLILCRGSLATHLGINTGKNLGNLRTPIEKGCKAST